MKKKPNAKAFKISRRKLLAAMSVGAAAKLPELWSKPMVASVMLPAHASRSPDPDSAPDPVPNCDCAILYARANYFITNESTYLLNIFAAATLNCTTLGSGESCSFVHSVYGTVQTVPPSFSPPGTCYLTQFVTASFGACNAASNTGQNLIVNFYDASGLICSDTLGITFTCQAR